MNSFTIHIYQRVESGSLQEICILLPLPGPQEPSPEALSRELKKLPDTQRLLLLLRCYDGLSESEIASLLELSRQEVHSGLLRAIRALMERTARELPSGALRDAFAFTIEQERYTLPRVQQIRSDLERNLRP